MTLSGAWIRAGGADPTRRVAAAATPAEETRRCPNSPPTSNLTPGTS